jgi:hypothetical protein
VLYSGVCDAATWLIGDLIQSLVFATQRTARALTPLLPLTLCLFTPTHAPRLDLTASGGALLSLLITLVVASIIQSFVHLSWLHLMLSAGGALLFSVYLVFGESCTHMGRLPGLAAVLKPVQLGACPARLYVCQRLCFHARPYYPYLLPAGSSSFVAWMPLTMTVTIVTDPLPTLVIPPFLQTSSC